MSRKSDIIFIGGLMFIGALLAGVYGLSVWKRLGTGAAVEVRVAGGERQRYSLEQNADVEISGTNGGVNRLHIEEGQAWITEASCPDKVCVHMGKISQPGQTIVCLPNQVVIEVVGE